MDNFIPAWLALCAEQGTWLALLYALTSGGGIAVSLFVVGLISGFTHCAGMCGPFMLMRVVRKAEGGAPPATLRRLERASLWRYHLGRTITYSGLGALAAGLTGEALGWIGFRWMVVAILLAVAVTIVFSVARGAAPLPAATGRLCRALADVAARAARLGDFPLGVALGFLPCGVLYGALAAAASTGEAASGALAMAAFALGTAPGLIAVAVGGAFFARRFRIASAVTTPLLAINIAILTAYILKAVV
jgi:sulfite exporter TauE/SafE